MPVNTGPLLDFMFLWKFFWNSDLICKPAKPNNPTAPIIVTKTLNSGKNQKKLRNTDENCAGTGVTKGDEIIFGTLKKTTKKFGGLKNCCIFVQN